MDEASVEIEQRGATAWIWLNRPLVHNALNDALVSQLTYAFRNLGRDAGVRVIVLAGRGKSFCAGADAQEMIHHGEGKPIDNLANARQLAEMFLTIASTPKPTIARVHGSAIGGGIGLVAACDIALASDTAGFATPEVRLGLIPATIAPYVVRAIGARWAMRLFQTGERIPAAQAEKIGLVHEVLERDELDTRLETVILDLLKGGPKALQAAKNLVGDVVDRPISAELVEDTALRIASARSEPEAQEGLAAFLEKRNARWVVER